MSQELSAQLGAPELVASFSSHALLATTALLGPGRRLGSRFVWIRFSIEPLAGGDLFNCHGLRWHTNRQSAVPEFSKFVLFYLFFQHVVLFARFVLAIVPRSIATFLLFCF